MVIRADLEASVTQTSTKLKVARTLEHEGFKQRLEAKKMRSKQISSIVKKVKAHHQKSQDDLRTPRCQVGEIEQALSAAKAREADLSQAI